MNHEHPHDHSCCGDKNVVAHLGAEAEHGCCGSHAQEDHRHAGTPRPGANYYCPMCPGLESETPGTCPRCGMALEHNPASKRMARTLYTCPMHPQIEQDHPGDC